MKKPKAIFRVCVPCQKGGCDCNQYDGLDVSKMPAPWFPHNTDKHDHNCHCYFEIEGSMRVELKKLNEALCECGEAFVKGIQKLTETLLVFKKAYEKFEESQENKEGLKGGHMQSKINEELGKSSSWKNRKCIYCGLKPSETILNIEGVIHHRAEMRCLDIKACNKRVKRKKNCNG